MLLRIAALETRFATDPWDVEEQRRRSHLIGYVIILPSDSALSSFQQVHGH